KKSLELTDAQEKDASKFKISKKYTAKKRTTDAYRGLALAYLGLGRKDEAVATLKAAVEKLPEDPSARAALGEALLVTGKPAEAIAEFETRLKLEPTTEAKLDLARAYTK